jgi:hypothetical protein
LLGLYNKRSCAGLEERTNVYRIAVDNLLRSAIWKLRVILKLVLEKGAMRICTCSGLCPVVCHVSDFKPYIFITIVNCTLMKPRVISLMGRLTMPAWLLFKQNCVLKRWIVFQLSLKFWVEGTTGKLSSTGMSASHDWHCSSKTISCGTTSKMPQIFKSTNKVNVFNTLILVFYYNTVTFVVFWDS